MLNFIIGMLIIIVAGLIGIWFYSVIFLPLFYGIPKAFYWCRKGILKYTSIFAYFRTLSLWIVVFGVIVVIVRIVSYSFFIKTLGSGQFLFPFIFSNILSFIYSFSKKSRQDLQHDFWSFVQRYRKPESASINEQSADESRSEKEVKEGQIDKKDWKLIQFLWLNLLNILGKYEKLHFEIGYTRQHMSDCFKYFKKTFYIDDKTRYHFKINMQSNECSTIIEDTMGVINKKTWTKIRYLWLELVSKLKQHSGECKELEYAWYRLLDLNDALDRVPFTDDGMEYTYAIDIIEERGTDKGKDAILENAYLAGMIINEMNYVVSECNKYIKKEEFDAERLFRFDLTIATIYIALILKYIEEYKIRGLRDLLLTELKDFYKSFTDPDHIEDSQIDFDWVIEMVTYMEKLLPSMQRKENWHFYINKFLSETAKSEVKEFFVGSYDKALISILLNHVELTAKYLGENMQQQNIAKNEMQREAKQSGVKKRLSVGVYIISILFIIFGGMWVLGYIVNPCFEMAGYFIWGIPLLVGGIGMLCRKHWALRLSQIYLIITAIPAVVVLIVGLFQSEKPPFFVFVIIFLIGAIFLGLPLWFLLKKSTVKQFKVNM